MAEIYCTAVILGTNITDALVRKKSEFALNGWLMSNLSNKIAFFTYRWL